MIRELLITYAKQHPWLLVLNVCFMVFVPFNEILLPHLYGRVVNAIQKMSGVEMILAITIGAVIITQIGYVLRDKLNEYFIPSFDTFLKVELVDKILDKYNKNFSNLTTGDLIYRLTIAPEIIILWFTWLNDFILPYLATFLIALVVFLRFDWMVGLAFLAFVCILVLVFTRAPGSCKDVAIGHANGMATFHEHLEEIINNMISIYSTGTQKEEIGRITELAHNRYFANYPLAARCARKYKFVMIPMLAVLLVVVVMRSKWLVGQKKKKPGDFVSAFFVLTSMLSSIMWMIEAIKYGVFDLGVLTSVDDIIKMTAKDDKVREKMPGRPPEGYALGMVGVSFGYGKKKTFENYSVGFERGQRTVIVGPVGKGKSTLLKLLLGFHVPDKGDVFLGDKWYSELELTEVRKRVGYIPQHPILFNNTVLFNVRYGNEHMTEEEVATFIKSVGLADKLEHGANTRVGKGGLNLSGGQRQLVWCLRVMLQNPEVLIMDEPTASMDDATKDLLLDMMNRMMEGKTVVFVSHDPYLIKMGTRRLEV